MREELGALWARKTKDGEDYYSGTITLEDRAIEIVVFKNKYKKEGEKTPDYRILKSAPREEVEAPHPGDEIPF